MTGKYELSKSDKLGRYLVAGKDLKAGETILSDEAFVLGPHHDTSLLCFNCYLPLVSKFLVCKTCSVAPVCPGDGCPDHLTEWHSKTECEFFRALKLTKGVGPMNMVQNVGSLTVLRALLKKQSDPEMWKEFMQLEMHLEERKKTGIWKYHESTVKFIEFLDITEDVENVVQRICAAIDVNSFEVRGPLSPAVGCSEFLRGVFLKAALIAHDCVGNTHISINDNNLLVCHASRAIKKGETIFYNYTDPLKGTMVRQQHLHVGKYFDCTCTRCSDITELGTYMSSAICTKCKEGYVTQNSEDLAYWTCNRCDNKVDSDHMNHRLQCCSDKFGVINTKDEKELEEYIRNVSLVLAPNHFLLLEAKQRLAGVLRDIINRETRPSKKVMKRKIELCQQILPVIEVLSPGICRTKAITLYELHATSVQLAKKLFDARELTGAGYLEELRTAEKHLKRALEMLFIEPGNSPEGDLCAKALEEYRALKVTMKNVLDAISSEDKTYVTGVADRSETLQLSF